MNMQTIKNLNKEKGQHFFEPGTMRFFRSRLTQNTKTLGNGDTLFITSEQFDGKSPRLYSVRKCIKKTGSIEEVSDFQQFETVYQAKHYMEKVEFAIRDGYDFIIIKDAKPKDKLLNDEYFALMITDKKQIDDTRKFLDETREWIGLERTSNEEIYVSKNYLKRQDSERGITLIVRMIHKHSARYYELTA